MVGRVYYMFTLLRFTHTFLKLIFFFASWVKLELQIVDWMPTLVLYVFLSIFSFGLSSLVIYLFFKTLFHLYHLLSHIGNECPLNPIWSFFTHTLEILGTLWLRGSNVDIVGIFHTIFLYKQWCFLTIIICIVSYCQWKAPTKWSSSFDGMCLQTRPCPI